MLMVYKVVILHEFGKVQGLIDLLFADKGFLGPKRSPAALPSENLSCRSQNQTFFRFFLERAKNNRLPFPDPMKSLPSSRWEESGG